MIYINLPLGTSEVIINRSLSHALVHLPNFIEQESECLICNRPLSIFTIQSLQLEISFLGSID